jgi:hypothetical protein
MILRYAIILILLCTALAACAETRPPLADTWGVSVRTAVEAQKLNPAPPTDRPMAGLDGAFAKNALDAYRKTAEPGQQSGADKGQPVELMLSTKGGK